MVFKSILIMLFVTITMNSYAISIYEKNLYLGIAKSSKKGARYFTKSIANLRSNNMKAVEVYKTKLCKRVRKTRSIKNACLYLSREISKKAKKGIVLNKKIKEKIIIKKSDKIVDVELSKPLKKEESERKIINKTFKRESVEGNIRIVEECKKYFCFKAKYINDKKVSYEVYNNKHEKE